MRRAVGTLLLVVVVVLAGCSGVFGGSGEPTATVTPAAVPTDRPTPTPVPQLAPGLTGEGIEDPDALLAAHESVLETRSFTMRSNTTAVAPNGSVVFQQTSTVRVGPVGEAAYAAFVRNGSYGYPGTATGPIRNEVWQNDDRAFQHRTYPNGTTTADRLPRGVDVRSVGTELGLRYTLEPLGPANTSVTERNRNSTTRYLVRGRIRNDDGFGRENRSLRLRVDSRGVIYAYRMVSSPSDETIARVVSEMHVSGIDTTDPPERPSWVEEAAERTTARPNPTVSTSAGVAATATNPSEVTNRTATEAP